MFHLLILKKRLEVTSWSAGAERMMHFFFLILFFSVYTKMNPTRATRGCYVTRSGIITFFYYYHFVDAYYFELMVVVSY